MNILQKIIQILFFNAAARLLYRTFVRLLFVVVSLGGFYVVLTRLFPAVDRRSPAVLAIIASYFVVAYLLFPFAIRIIRLVNKPHTLPRFTTTPDGFLSDPINVSVIGSAKELEQAFLDAGWFKADKRTFSTTLKSLKAIISGREYSSAPFSNLLLFGRPQDVGFQKPVPGRRFHRHHVRFWNISRDVADDFESQVGFWKRAHGTDGDSGDLWVGAAIKDIGVGFIRYHGQITHAVDPDTNKERDLIVRDLKKTSLFSRAESARAGLPLVVKNRVLSNKMFADGRISVVRLKKT